MILDDMRFPENKIVVFYGVGAYAADFVKKRCLEEGRLPLPDFFCDDNLGGPEAEYFGKPLWTWQAIADEYDVERLIIVVLALAGGSLAIPGKNAREWDFADIRIGRCMDMRYELEDRKTAGELRAARSVWADEESRIVFDAMTDTLANGAIWCRSIYDPNPYFGNDVIHEVRKGEVYIDAGANRGEDMRRLAAMNPKYGGMVGFEPDNRVFEELERAFADPRVAVHCQGLADYQGRAGFDSTGACGRMSEAGSSTAIEVVRLDACGIENISLVKMDVEGSEAAALRGSAGVISAARPKLAISAYHKADDLFVLPGIILGMRADYRLYLRHHSVFTAGTVIYAV